MQEKGNDVPAQEPQAGWVFTPGAAVPQTPTPAQPVENPNPSNSPAPLPQAEAPFVPKSPQASVQQEGVVSWTASEYIGNPKTMSWFAMLAAATVSVGVIVYILTTDLVSAIVIGILGIVVGIFAARQPHVLEYALDRSGIHLGQRFYPYSFFKTFSVVEDGAFSHITLLPLKRFVPPLTVHYAPTDESKITSTLSDYLPYEEHKVDPIENFSRRVRF